MFAERIAAMLETPTLLSARDSAQGIHLMKERRDLSLKVRKVPRVVREEFELACIREFSHSGQHLGAGVSRGERRERISASILRENKTRRRWQDSEFSYAEVYAQVYQQPLAESDSHVKDSLGKWRAGLDDHVSDDDSELDSHP
jgi:hypothetical protein